MEDTLLKLALGLVMIVGTAGMYWLLYRCIRRYKRNRQKPRPGGTRKLLIYWPLILLNAVPGYMVMLNEQGGSIQNPEIWEIGLFLCFCVTMVVTFLECGLRALWMGPLRWFIGVGIGYLVSLTVLTVFGLLLVLGVGLVRTNGETHIRVHFNNGTRELVLNGQDGHWRDPSTGRTYLSYGDGKVIDEYGNTFPYD